MSKLSGSVANQSIDLDASSIDPGSVILSARIGGAPSHLLAPSI